MKTKNYLFTLFFLVFAATLSLAQEAYKANIKSFTTVDGLSHLDVYCFEKDTNGILWVGTRDGLNRFDGRQFKVFTQKNGLVYKSVNILYKDGDFLWCVHHNRTTNTDFLSLFNIPEEKVYSLEEYLGKNLPFKQSEIKKIHKVQDALLFKTTEQNTYIYTEKKGLKRLPFIRKEEEVKGILENGDFWILDFSKKYFHLRRVDKKGKELFVIEKKAIPFNNTPFIDQRKDGKSYFGYSPLRETRSWFIISNQGDFKKQKASFFFEKNKETSIISHYTKYYPQYNAYWYSAFDTCALLTLDQEHLYHTILKVKDARYSFLDKNIVWIANTKDGFSQLEIQKDKFTRLFNNAKYNGFRGITKINAKVYLNSYPHTFIFDTQLKTSQKAFFIGLTVLKDKKENLWGFKNKKLVKYNAELKVHVAYPVAYDDSLPAWSIFEDKNGLIWYSDVGLKSFNPKTEEFQKFMSNQFPEIEEGIVYHFYEKEDGNILLCTTTGLYEMELDKGIIARYWEGGKGKYHIPASDFRHLYFDKKNQSYWLATNERGLIQWKPQTNTSESHTFSHRTANIIHAVYADEFGFLWLSTENGIIQFEKKTGDFKVYLPKDGTSTHEFNRISHFQDEAGKIYFGGVQGVTTFEPKDFYQDFKSHENTKIIPIEINQYKEKTGEIENVTAKFHQKKEINFYPKDRFLTFIFGLTDYRYSKEAIYYYKLKNKDKNWTSTKNNEITISGMPYGEQILEVKALLENGKFTKEHLEISIIVHKPFYLQWWFFVLFFLIVFGTTLLYIRYRTRKFTLQQLVLENEVQKRTLKIENDKKIIEEQAAKLIELDKTKTRFFANVSHELRTPITLIKAPIQFVIKNEKLNERSEYLLTKAAESTNNLLNLVNEILDLTKLDNQKLHLEEEKVIFYNLVRQIVSNFQSIAQIQAIEMMLNYQANKDLQLVLDKGKFQKILNNLLSNALKFTPSKGKITITIEDLGGKIRLEVADTGRGIPTADIPHIFERYFQSSQNNKAEGGLGIGLALSMELVKLFEGKMWLESSTKKENQGTSFFVEFPKKEILNMLTTKDALEIEKDFSSKKKSQISDKKDLLNAKAKKTLLVVEDNIDLREYLTFTLSPYYEVLTAQNGKEALEILVKGEVPDLIISDLMMPIMDGYEFLETVKNKDKWAGIPFIMLTARAMLQDKLKALRVGVDAYITKPFEEEELLVQIENLLKNYAERLSFSQAEEGGITQEKNKALSLNQEDRKWLENFETLVLNQLHSPLFSNDYLAELLKMDRKTLYKKVKINTGLTPTQYIKTLRLKLAKDLLENREYKTVKEIAKQVGFKKTAYFSNLFKEEYGKSPSDYF